MPAEHRSLEAALTPPARRGSGLGDLLPRAPRPVAAVPTESAPEPTTEAVVSERPVAERRERSARAETRPAARPATQPRDSATFNVAAYLPQPVLDAASLAIRQQGTTYAQLLWSAFAGVSREELESEFAPMQPADHPWGVPLAPARSRGAAGVQRQFRLTAAQREWLDDQVESLGAPSRSALIAAVLSRHLQA